MSRRNPSKGLRRPWDEWLLSECAPFIRRILARWATDADRTAVAREFADWLEARGDKMDNARWFRHPKLRWEKTAYGISWSVHPWDNNGHGAGARIDYFWWTARYPTRAYIESEAAATLVRAWITNRVDFEEYPWTREVAARLGPQVLAEYDRQVKDRADTKERYRLAGIEQEIREHKQHVEYLRKYGTARFTDGGGI